MIKLKYEFLLIFVALLSIHHNLFIFFAASPPVKPSTADTTNYTVYLSFDDGPMLGSEQMLNIIDSEKIKVNVFLVGKNVQANPYSAGLYQRFRTDSLVETGNHSYTHADGHYLKYYRNTQKVINDFLKNETELTLTSRIARLPGRNIWRTNHIKLQDGKSGVIAADSLYNRGFIITGWDIEWQYDEKTAAPKQTAASFISTMKQMLQHNSTVVKNKIVVLAHDEMFWNKWSLQQLQQLIQLLKSDPHIRFDHLSNYQ